MPDRLPTPLRFAVVGIALALAGCAQRPSGPLERDATRTVAADLVHVLVQLSPPPASDAVRVEGLSTAFGTAVAHELEAAGYRVARRRDEARGAVRSVRHGTEIIETERGRTVRYRLGYAGLGLERSYRPAPFGPVSNLRVTGVPDGAPRPRLDRALFEARP